MDRVRLAEITESLETTFGDYAETQGLRFRSSSSVEDIEGFNGAGLYDSNTGFLQPERQPDEDDHKKSSRADHQEDVGFVLGLRGGRGANPRTCRPSQRRHGRSRPRSIR